MFIALLTTLVAALAVVPLWLATRSSRGGRAVALGMAAMAAAVAVATFVFERETDLAPMSRPLVEPAAGYVGSASCRTCHPIEHSTWHDSYHRTMTQVATRDVIVDEFDRRELDWFGKKVVLEWRGDRLWVEFDRGGRDPRHVRRPVEQTTGSHHFQVLWYSTGLQRQLAPVPVCFKLEERIWMPLTAVFVVPPEYRDPPEPGKWNRSCHMCHATHVRPRIDFDRSDTHVTELGIACEACHGPGAEHIAANQNPLRRYAQRLAADGDDTVTNPERLTRARSAQVCGQCHSVNILRRTHFEAWPEHGLAYRPGDDLRRTNVIIDRGSGDAPELRPTLKGDPDFFDGKFWLDGEVRVSGREYNGLVTSPCYTHGDAEHQLDCASCHTMHSDDAGWRDDQLKPGMRGNAACTQCHEEYRDDDALVAHTHHAKGSVGSNCYDCHMSHTTFGLMKAMRSHKITSPSVQAELATGRPNACNLCHLDRTLAWTGAQLEQKWGVAMPDAAALDDDRREVAAGARWLLSGDAGVRAIVAWSAGWAPAHEASGRDWLAPYLARLLDDPYYAVRFGAARSLRSLGVEAELDEYDFLAEPKVARQFGERVRAAWQRDYSGGVRAEVLIGESATMTPSFARLYALRDDRKIFLAE